MKAGVLGATQHVGERLHELRNAANHPEAPAGDGQSMNFIDVAGDDLARRDAPAPRGRW
jgi:hypothetical protein